MMKKQIPKNTKCLYAALSVLICLAVIFNAGLVQVYGASGPATPKITYLKSTAIDSFTVKSNKNSKVTGYQIRYSLNKDFKSSKYSSAKGTQLNKKVTGLKGGRTYYVKIRAYKLVRGKKRYSAWSSWKSAPITKNENSVTRYTTAANTNVYTKADSGSSHITLWYATKVKLISSLTSSSSGTWYKVKYQDKYYYLWDKTKDPVKFTGNNPVKSDDGYLAGCTTDLQRDILANAFDIYHNWDTAYDYGSVYSEDLEMEGDKYLFHCSGFVLYLYNSTMQKYAPPFFISGTAESLGDIGCVLNEGLQGEIRGETVCSGTLKTSSLKPGDILCFKMMSDNDRAIDHVAMYIGNGQIIHSTRALDGKYTNSGLDPDGGVCIAPLSGSYKDGFRKAVRLLPDEVETADLEMTVAAEVLDVMADRDCSEISEEEALHAGDTVKVLFTYGSSAYIAYGDDYEKTGYIYDYEEELN